MSTPKWLRKKQKNRYYKETSWSRERRRKSSTSRPRKSKYQKINAAKARAARLAVKPNQTVPEVPNSSQMSDSGPGQSICIEVPSIASTYTCAPHSPRAARRPQRHVKLQSSRDNNDHVSSLHCYRHQYSWYDITDNILSILKLYFLYRFRLQIWWLQLYCYPVNQDPVDHVGGDVGTQ